MPGKKDPKTIPVIEVDQDNECPKKQGDNCLVPGAYNDSDPIGGGG
jgi:hypothetical protein